MIEKKVEGVMLMNGRALLDAALNDLGITYKEAAEKIGWSKCKISNKLVHDTLRASELLHLLEANGIGVMLVNKNNEEVIYPYSYGHGEPYAGRDGTILYDTTKAYALSNTFYADGEHEYTDGKAEELYVDKEHRYFIVHYEKGKRPYIRGVRESIARAFIEKYGPITEKN